MITRIFSTKSCQRTLAGVALGLLATLALTGLPTSAQQATAPTAQQGRQLSLRSQLALGLRARTKADKAFIDKVVLLVKQGKLPRSLVDSTFLWSRERARKRSFKRRLRPIVFFKPGLTQRALKIGVKL